MAALGDDSGMANDHAAYPLPSAWDPGAVRSPDQIRPNVPIPLGAIPYAAKLTPGRPFVKRRLVVKSLFLTRKLALAHFFTSV